MIDGDHVICCPFGQKASIVALDKQTGKTVWAAPSTGDKAGYATPSVVDYAGLRMILTMNQAGLVGVNADNGDLLFRYEHPTKYDVNVLKPIFRDGRVFITSGYGAGSEMIALRVAGNKVTATQAWQDTTMDNHHGGVVLVDGYLYGSSARGKWRFVSFSRERLLPRPTVFPSALPGSMRLILPRSGWSNRRLFSAGAGKRAKKLIPANSWWPATRQSKMPGKN